MLYIILGITGLLVIHVFDVASIRRLPVVKPVIWAAGSILFVFAVVMLALETGTLPLPVWMAWPGWALFAVSSVLLVFSLFINLPLKKTYIDKGVGDRLIRSGLYSLVRHPGVLSLTLVLLSLILVSRSLMLLVATPVFLLLDVILVVIQDRVFFVKMFSDYRDYQQETPMLLPRPQSLIALLKPAKTIKNKSFT